MVVEIPPNVPPQFLLCQMISVDMRLRSVEICAQPFSSMHYQFVLEEMTI